MCSRRLADIGTYTRHSRKSICPVTQQITSIVSGFVSVTNLTNNEDYEFLNSVPIMGRTTVVGVRSAVLNDETD